MQLLSPGVLWALAALAVPILLHLFYFRRFRRVAFTNVRFLREVKDETQRRSRLRNLLVLALRLLAFAAVVLAFAQPLLGGADGDDARAPQRVSIVVDNSRSMAAQSSEVALLEKAKQRARDIILAHDESTEFQLVTNDVDGASSRWLTRDDALSSVDGVGFGESPLPGAQLLSRVLDPGAGQRPSTYLISDFQRSQYRLDDLTADSARAPAVVPVAAVETRNVSIDSAYLLTPVQLRGEPIEIVVALTNHGDDDAESVRLAATVEGNAQPFGLRRVPAGRTVLDTVALSSARAGWTRAELRITDFPIEFDDRYYVALEVRAALSVLAISDGPLRPELAAAFPAGGALELTHERASNVNYSRLGGYDLVVLDDLANVPSGLTQQLATAVAAGTKALVFPGASADGGGYRALLQALKLPALGTNERGDFGGARLNTASFVFSDVYERLPRNTRLPAAKLRYGLRAGGAETLLSFRDGRAFVVGQPSGTGIAYLSAAPLGPEGSDLLRTPEVFVPMLYRMAFSGGAAQPIAYVIGGGGVLALPLSEGLGEAALEMRSGSAGFVPPQRQVGQEVVLSFGQAIPAPGHFDVLDQRDSTLAVVAFNFDRAESPMSFYDEAELAAAGLTVYDGDDGDALSAALAGGALGTPWWPYLVALALAALVAEACVLRFWRPGQPARPASARPVSTRARPVAAAE